jgi:S-methylmethionine-dependent homocysteine/selenocysteine methylase
MSLTLLDGPMGTELIARGHPCPAPEWSAWALLHAPQAVSEIHREYAKAGAQVHTTNTFRTRPDALGAQWEDCARRAVRLARAAAGPGQRVAGSIAPLADCYQPQDSPDNPGPRHAALARVLADAGVDLMLCETFPHIGECLAALDAAMSTGVETWISLTAGPDADLLTPKEIFRGAAAAVERGASAVLVNCIPATRTSAFLAPLASLGVPFGAYANAGHTDDGIGWHPDPDGPNRYAEYAQEWVDLGATIIGSCCGTGPDHIRALHTRFVSREP